MSWIVCRKERKSRFGDDAKIYQFEDHELAKNFCEVLNAMEEEYSTIWDCTLSEKLGKQKVVSLVNELISKEVQSNLINNVKLEGLKSKFTCS